MEVDFNPYIKNIQKILFEQTEIKPEVERKALEKLLEKNTLPQTENNTLKNRLVTIKKMMSPSEKIQKQNQGSFKKLMIREVQQHIQNLYLKEAKINLYIDRGIMDSLSEIEKKLEQLPAQTEEDRQKNKQALKAMTSPDHINRCLELFTLQHQEDIALVKEINQLQKKDAKNEIKKREELYIKIEEDLINLFKQNILPVLENHSCNEKDLISDFITINEMLNPWIYIREKKGNKEIKELHDALTHYIIIEIEKNYPPKKTIDEIKTDKKDREEQHKEYEKLRIKKPTGQKGETTVIPDEYFGAISQLGFGGLDLSPKQAKIIHEHQKTVYGLIMIGYRREDISTTTTEGLEEIIKNAPKEFEKILTQILKATSITFDQIAKEIQGILIENFIDVIRLSKTKSKGTDQITFPIEEITKMTKERLTVNLNCISLIHDGYNPEKLLELGFSVKDIVEADKNKIKLMSSPGYKELIRLLEIKDKKTSNLKFPPSVVIAMDQNTIKKCLSIFLPLLEINFPVDTLIKMENKDKAKFAILTDEENLEKLKILTEVKDNENKIVTPPSKILEMGLDELEDYLLFSPLFTEFSYEDYSKMAPEEKYKKLIAILKAHYSQQDLQQDL